ncbi:TPA: LytS/YhcK type 5TM receptor domain-containing protein [Photobacterium damselae]|uniref:LytS/YhcK type 5TM receptor domain-containing protein n=1 Tax=Photobacterium damselae TaxID=38293 RepID=UPI000A3004D3|nr:LytS/YhcK type 5TM receptor domain-containing protein [Photobacterium damselae]ARR50679.1 sensor histidine kinase [Photobacterium damselae subsp. damselae]QAY36443.1 sensor histidine kinase [Photobacterium damselae subsp. damselae]QOQ70131.1 histidine kinase [Photobacterium damselae subsp. damselae]
MMLLAVFERAALMLMALFLLTRTPLFQDIVKKKHRRPIETAMISLLFILFAVFSTYTGVKVDGSLVNVRIIAVISGGIIFGPWIGIPAGIIAGIHRYLIDIDGPTSVACLITSVIAGLLATWIHKKCAPKHYAKLGILAGMVCEALTMTLIVVLSNNDSQAYTIVSHISFPMITGTLCIGLIIKLVQDLDEEKDLVAARQAKLALDIANKTLPYFRKSNRESLMAVCNIIRHETEADAVSITDTQDVLAYVGIGEENYLDAYHKISTMTQQAVTTGQQIISNNLNIHNFHSLLIIPLCENGEVTGTLKIFYRQPNQVKPSLREMAIGLSQLISTQMEVSRIDQLRTMASKAEFSALQSKINPHFLFNALNAISTLVRIRPDQARELIANLADFLRYNLDHTDELIDIQEELQQVKDYVAIEQARFGNKLSVNFDIDDVHNKIPALLLQPLVENAILHGIQPSAKPGQVSILVKRLLTDEVQVIIEDTGVGIKPEVITKLRNGNMESHRIGLQNVHQRLLLLYGEGLEIVSDKHGTKMSFIIH